MITVLYGDGTGRFGSSRADLFGGYVPRAIALGDLNGDGRTDIAVTNASGMAVFVAADGPGWQPRRDMHTSSGLWVNLEECSGCGLSGWGWRDDAWGTAGAMSGTLVRFPQGGLQTIRIQTREDGVSVDQIVLSARKYKSTRPGTVKNDATVLPFTAFWGS